eukprot:scaffold6009_cov17-Tisochrysis_lutea.AAC.2
MPCKIATCTSRPLRSHVLQRLPQSQPSNAAQLPDRMGTSGSELKPNTGGTDCLSLDKSTTKGAEGEQLTVLADASQGDSAPSWDAHYVDRLPSSPPQKQRSHPAPAKKSSSGVSEAHGFEGRCSSRRDAQVGSASSELHLIAMHELHGPGCSTIPARLLSLSSVVL